MVHCVWIAQLVIIFLSSAFFPIHRNAIDLTKWNVYASTSVELNVIIIVFNCF
jgi:hypothetical protein